MARSAGAMSQRHGRSACGGARLCLLAALLALTSGYFTDVNLASSAKHDGSSLRTVQELYGVSLEMDANTILEIRNATKDLLQDTHLEWHSLSCRNEALVSAQSREFLVNVDRDRATSMLNARSHAELVQSATGDLYNEKLIESERRDIALENWAREHGAQFPKLRIARFVSRRYTRGRSPGSPKSLLRGMMALSFIGKDEKVLHVPRKLFLTARIAREGPLRVRLKDDNVVLNIALMFERCRTISLWRPYIDAMPSMEDVWREAQGMLFRSDNEGRRHALLQSAVQRSYDALAELFRVDAWSTAGCNEDDVSFRAFLWADTMRQTRSFVFDSSSDSGETVAMIPLADLVNHYERGAIWGYDEEKTFSLQTKLSYAPCDQVYNVYGPHSGDYLLNMYGFAPAIDHRAALQLPTRSPLAGGVITPEITNAGVPAAVLVASRAKLLGDATITPNDAVSLAQKLTRWLTPSSDLAFEIGTALHVLSSIRKRLHLDDTISARGALARRGSSATRASTWCDALLESPADTTERFNCHVTVSRRDVAVETMRRIQTSLVDEFDEALAMVENAEARGAHEHDPSPVDETSDRVAAVDPHVPRYGATADRGGGWQQRKNAQRLRERLARVGNVASVLTHASCVEHVPTASAWGFRVCGTSDGGKVEQFLARGGDVTFSLGALSRDALDADEPYREYAGGSAEMCTVPRRARIDFTCGQKLEIVHVEEPEVCVYLITMSVPQVCDLVDEQGAKRSVLDVAYVSDAEHPDVQLLRTRAAALSARCAEWHGDAAKLCNAYVQSLHDALLIAKSTQRDLRSELAQVVVGRADHP